MTASSIQLESPLSGPHATHDSPDSPSPGWTPRAFGMGTGIAASGYSQASPSSLVYAIGMVGYDFGTETRRDSLLQQSGKDVRVPAQLLLHLKANPSAAAGVIWTLGIEGVPVYAIAPSGPFADTTYERLRQFLLAQSTGAAMHFHARGDRWIRDAPERTEGPGHRPRGPGLVGLVHEIPGLIGARADRPGRKQARGSSRKSATFSIAFITNFATWASRHRNGRSISPLPPPTRPGVSSRTPSRRA